jgi:hypothetical protein
MLADIVRDIQTGAEDRNITTKVLIESGPVFTVKFDHKVTRQRGLANTTCAPTFPHC